MKKHKYLLKIEYNKSKCSCPKRRTLRGLQKALKRPNNWRYSKVEYVLK